MKPRERVLEELQPLIGPMSDLGFKLRRSGAFTFHHDIGRGHALGSRSLLANITVASRGEAVEFGVVPWSVWARCNPSIPGKSLILSAFSYQIPGWKLHTYPGSTAASDAFRLDDPSGAYYQENIRPLVAHNMLLGASFLLEHHDYRKAAGFAVGQKNCASYERAFDLYMLAGDLDAARAVVDLAAADPGWSPDRWEARRALLRRS
jgi:hypothetical protein